MIDLSNVTLVSIDSASDYESKSNIRLAAISRIVPEILKEIKFGDVLIINPFSKNKELLNIEFEPMWSEFNLSQNPKNIGWLNNYLIKVLPNLIKTEWYLIIQWDGFPINPKSWSDEFFDYPFLGGGHSILNGGFSLRNKDTMIKVSQINETFETGSEDALYSVYLDNKYTTNKKTPFKIKWPDANIIDKFCTWEGSQILDGPSNSFGWHKHSHLSKTQMTRLFHHIGIFSNKEIQKLVSYCLLKEIDIPFKNIEIENLINNFDIEFNNEFFDMY